MNNAPNKKIVIAIVIVLLALAAGGGYLLARDAEPGVSSTNDQSSQSRTTDDSASTSTDSYADGEYQAVGSYRSPAGNESLEVTLTLSGGTVSDANVTSKAKNSTSRGYQQDFIGSFKSEVIGKSISEIELDAVGGSSLTPNGFNEAVEQIKQDAAA